VSEILLLDIILLREQMRLGNKNRKGTKEKEREEKTRKGKETAKFIDKN